MRLIVILLAVFLTACSTLTTKDKTNFPIINLVNIEGNSVVINGEINKPTVLLLFDYNCVHCVRAIQDIEDKFLGLVNESEVQFIAVGRDHDVEYLQSLKAKDNIKIELIADPKRVIFTFFANKSVPRVYLYDKRGELKYSHVGWSDKVSDRILGEISRLIGWVDVVVTR
ncbi:hypothetical protein A9Q99_22765 [Gammaproteobacteria bacterium 45_16_T64]|nr:hypothetical protein A9Q99_22765 [Gammaproteobacteria bacterium 45_16_T64]